MDFVFACLETAVMFLRSVTSLSHMNENSDHKTSMKLKFFDSCCFLLLGLLHNSILFILFVIHFCGT